MVYRTTTCWLPRGDDYATCMSVGRRPSARANILGNAYHDPRRDELVVTVFYCGTNSDHEFSLKNGGLVARTRMGKDVEQHDYAKTTRSGLATPTCRPART
jgi:hypothetical protein